MMLEMVLFVYTTCIESFQLERGVLGRWVYEFMGYNGHGCIDFGRHMHEL
jgi:hypothetical protein